jgi:hypothetical protein
MFSVTEDRLAEPDADALAGADDAGSDLELELPDEEQAAAASPTRARTGIAISFGLRCMLSLFFDSNYREITGVRTGHAELAGRG